LIAILLDYIIPIIYDSFITLIIVLLILFILRVRDSGIRILFFFLPLIKPFLAVAERLKPDAGAGETPQVYSGIRIPDPNNLFGWFEKIEGSRNLFTADINYFIILIVGLVIILLLLARWFNLYLFYRKLAYEDRVSRDEIPLVYRIIDSFAEKLSIRPPNVSLTHRPYHSPFVVGIRHCTIVIYPNILEVLEQEEKEFLLHHELSHIKRRDNLISWIAMILRDFMFFNPFAYIAYYLIRSEQDSGSDKLVALHSRKPAREIAKALLNAVKKLGDMGVSRPVPDGASGFVNTTSRFFAHFRLRNRIRSIIRNDYMEIRMRVFPRILMYLLFLLILIMQMLIVIDFGQYHIYLR
jgi:beta-lactamase regulating signal transducer with metallopeptidase domain